LPRDGLIWQVYNNFAALYHVEVYLTAVKQERSEEQVAFQYEYLNRSVRAVSLKHQLVYREVADRPICKRMEEREQRGGLKQSNQP